VRFIPRRAQLHRHHRRDLACGQRPLQSLRAASLRILSNSVFVIPRIDIFRNDLSQFLVTRGGQSVFAFRSSPTELKRVATRHDTARSMKFQVSRILLGNPTPHPHYDVEPLRPSFALALKT